MKAKTVVPLIIGLGVGFFAIKQAVDMASRAKGATVETRKVVVASNTIPSATKITEQMLTLVDVPTALTPHGAFTDIKTLAGRVTKLTVPAGVAVGQTMLAPPGSEPGLRALIPEGYRAVAVKVNEASAVAGFVAPGVRVDVFAGEGGRRGVSNKSRLILSDVEIGAVGQSLNEVGSDGKTVKVSKSVTLFLKPEQVPVLHAAASREQISLAMRGDGEKGESFWSKLFKKDEAPAMDEEETEEVVKPKRPKEEPVQVAVAPTLPPIKTHVVEVLQGSKLERVYFDEKGNLVRDANQDAKDKHGRGHDAGPDPASAAAIAPIMSDPK